jgi:hypothetical protein
MGTFGARWYVGCTELGWEMAVPGLTAASAHMGCDGPSVVSGSAPIGEN